MRKTTLTLLTIFFASAGSSQSYNPSYQFPQSGIIFDDFYYTSLQLGYTSSGSYTDRNYTINSLYGKNYWCRDYTSCSSRIESRFWYQYLWPEVQFSNIDPESHLETGVGSDKRLVFVQEADQPHPSGTYPQQIVSGFTARTGVWAAKMKLAALPNLTTPHTAQSFWTIAPHQTITSPGGPPYAHATNYRMRTEVDFEWNNWFGYANSAGVSHYLHTGFFEQGDGQGNVNPMRATAWPGFEPVSSRPGYSCRLDYNSQGGYTIRTAPSCTELLRGKRAGVGPVDVHFLLRYDGNTMKFEVQSYGWGGLFLMESDDITGLVPSQQMMAAFSQYLWSDTAVSFPEEQRMEVDWFYYSPEASRSFNAVLQDVQELRNRNAYFGYSIANPKGARVNTVVEDGSPKPLGRPYTISNGQLVPQSNARTVKIDGPRTSVVGSQTYYTFTADLGRLKNDYRVEWQTYASGQWVSQGGTKGHRFTTATPVSCSQIRVVVQALQYQNVNGVVSYAPIPNDVVTGYCAPSLQSTVASTVGHVVDKPYPNPADGRVSIPYGGASVHGMTVVVHDVVGREVRRISLPPSGAPGVAEVNTSDLAPGLYVATVEGAGPITRHRFTVAR